MELAYTDTRSARRVGAEQRHIQRQELPKEYSACILSSTACVSCRKRQR